MIVREDNLFLRLEIDGSELPTSVNLIDNVVMTEGNGALSPALEMVLNDFNGHLQASRALTDGNLIVVTVGKKINDIKNVTRQYRLFGHKQIQTASGPQIRAIGIYDAPGYLTGSATEAFEGTSSDTLKNVAKTCKLTYSGPEEFNGRALKDSQIWRNICRSRASFCADMAQHGHIDDSSAMYLALTSLGILKYRNLMDVIEVPVTDIKRTFIHNTPDKEAVSGHVTYLVHEARDRSTAGLMNTWQNYGSTRVEHSLTGVQADHTKVDVVTKASYLPVNDQVSKTVGRARIDYAPLDCGNTHDSYERALYQNLKLIGLFSERLSILTYDITDVQILDPVIYRQANEDLTIAAKNSDVYIVIGKSVIISGGRYYAERLELCRMSLTAKGETKLKTAATEPATDAKTSMPDVVINPTVNSAQTLLPNAKALSTTAGAAQTSMVAVKQNLQFVNSSIGTSLNTFNKNLSVLNSIKAGSKDFAGAAATLARSNSALAQLTGAAASLATSMASAQQTINTLSQNMLASTLSPIVKQATLFNPGGIFDTYTASLGTLNQLRSTASVLGTVSSTLSQPAYAGIATANLQAVTNVQAHSTALNSSVNASMNASGRIWNSLLSMLNNVPQQTASASNATVHDSVMKASYGISTSASRSTQPMSTASQSVLDTMMKKTNSQQLPWMPDQVSIANPIQAPTLDSTQTVLDQMAADQAYAQVRGTELSPTSWSN